MEGEKLVVTKLTDGDFLRKLENAIQVKYMIISSLILEKFSKFYFGIIKYLIQVSYSLE